MTTTVQAGANTAPAAGPTVLGWFEPGTSDWHAARANGIGGSEIAAVLGLSPYESRFSLWHRKKGLLHQGDEALISVPEGGAGFVRGESEDGGDL